MTPPIPAHDRQQIKIFLLGCSVSILVLFVFFAGALADRIFVIKPLDYFADPRFTGYSNQIYQPELSNEGSAAVVASMTDLVPRIVEEASVSVVTVSVKRQQPVLQNLGGVFGLGWGVPTGQVEEVQQDIGTGFVVAGQGLVVTNRHVVADPTAEYQVITSNDTEYQVSDIYRDPTVDLAILKLESEPGQELVGLVLGDSDQVRVGESVIAIGTALGEFRHTVTTGVVSGLGRGIQAVGGGNGITESLEGVIQTDAAINPGNSGGPLLDIHGRVIGVNAATSVAAENIGFAVPINVVAASIENFNQTGQFDRAVFGVRYQTVSQSAALLNEVPQGAYLVAVAAGSPAAKAGLEVGDIVTDFDGVALKDIELSGLINRKKIGDSVKVSWWRNGEVFSREITLSGSGGG